MAEDDPEHGEGLDAIEDIKIVMFIGEDLH